MKRRVLMLTVLTVATGALVGCDTFRANRDRDRYYDTSARSGPTTTTTTTTYEYRSNYPSTYERTRTWTPDADHGYYHFF
jgi:hypothetical protein